VTASTQRKCQEEKKNVLAEPAKKLDNKPGMKSNGIRHVCPRFRLKAVKGLAGLGFFSL
jgi:hypothetical protein